MYDKQQVRRRRALLAALVGVSLILLTAYFGESPSSPLHDLQRGVAQVVSPIQRGASKALAPVRDIAGFFSSTFTAKSQVASLRTELGRLRAQNSQLQQAVIENGQLSKEVGLDRSLGIDDYRPLAATVIARNPALWYQTIEVDQGSAAGVAQNDPVLGDGALVGDVTTVGSDFSVVTLITDHTFSVAAEVQDSVGDTGLLVPAVGAPNQLILQDLPQHAPIRVGQQVVTAGFRAGKLDSLYPAAIPIGSVTNASQNSLIDSQTVQVSPLADLRHVDEVQILTAPHAGTVRAQAGSHVSQAQAQVP